MELIAAAGEREGLPIETEITEPCIDQTFWVNIIGRGYIPPTREFSLVHGPDEILPTKRLLERLTREAKGTILLIGTRRAESQNRRRTMDRRGVSAHRLNPHSMIDGCRMFAPLAELDDADVWMTLIQRKPPWGELTAACLPYTVMPVVENAHW